MGSDDTEEDLGGEALGSTSSFFITSDKVVDFNSDLLDDFGKVQVEVLFHDGEDVGGAVNLRGDVASDVEHVGVAGGLSVGLDLSVQSREAGKDGGEVLGFEKLDDVGEVGAEGVEAWDAVLLDFFGGKAVLLGFTDTEGSEVEGTGG